MIDLVLEPIIDIIFLRDFKSVIAFIVSFIISVVLCTINEIIQCKKFNKLRNNGDNIGCESVTEASYYDLHDSLKELLEPRTFDYFNMNNEDKHE